MKEQHVASAANVEELQAARGILFHLLRKRVNEFLEGLLQTIHETRLRVRGIV